MACLRRPSATTSARNSRGPLSSIKALDPCRGNGCSGPLRTWVLFHWSPPVLGIRWLVLAISIDHLGMDELKHLTQSLISTIIERATPSLLKYDYCSDLTSCTEWLSLLHQHKWSCEWSQGIDLHMHDNAPLVAITCKSRKGFHRSPRFQARFYLLSRGIRW